MLVFIEVNTYYKDFTKNENTPTFQRWKKITFEVIFQLPITYKIVTLEIPKHFLGRKISDNHSFQRRKLCPKVHTAEGRIIGLKQFALQHSVASSCFPINVIQIYTKIFPNQIIS